jgi:hypothetical protein
MVIEVVAFGPTFSPAGVKVATHPAGTVACIV